MTRIAAAVLSVLTLCAFVVEGPRQPAPDALSNIANAPRWTANTGSLLDTGERGLGGGVEYAVDPSVCAMRFLDGSDCGVVTAAIALALDEWASGHPAINFVDVTARRAPAFPLARFGDSAQGAEIDFFGSTGREFPPFFNTNTTGYTIFYERPKAEIQLTNGTSAQGPAEIESADIRFNAARCFYIDTQKGRPDCVHFPSLVLHEVAHALGIGHPEERVGLNVDTDLDPANEMVIDCNAPLSGLKASPNYSGASIAIGRDVQGPGRWRRGLTWDDVAARDVLYPHCGIERIERFSEQWGAFAISSDGFEGRAQFEGRPDIAAGKAKARCEASSQRSQCHVVAEFQGCFAYAADGRGSAGHAKAQRSDHARVDAVLACADGGADCRVTADFCAFE